MSDIQARHDAAGDGRRMDLGDGWQAHEDRGVLLAENDILRRAALAAAATLGEEVPEDAGPETIAAALREGVDTQQGAFRVLAESKMGAVESMLADMLASAASVMPDKLPTTHETPGIPAEVARDILATPELSRVVAPTDVACLDCGAPYDDKRLDVVLPHDQWRAIHSDEDGILCASCIARRARKLPGAVRLAARVEFAGDDPLSLLPPEYVPAAGCDGCGNDPGQRHGVDCQPLSLAWLGGTREATLAKLPADVAALVRDDAPLTPSERAELMERASPATRAFLAAVKAGGATVKDIETVLRAYAAEDRERKAWAAIGPPPEPDIEPAIGE